MAVARQVLSGRLRGACGRTDADVVRRERDTGKGCWHYPMRVTQKGQVTILVVEPARAARQIRRMRGAGEVAMTTDEILALTRK